MLQCYQDLCELSRHFFSYTFFSRVKIFLQIFYSKYYNLKYLPFSCRPNFLGGTHFSSLCGVRSYAKGKFLVVVATLLQGVFHFQGGGGVGVAIVEEDFALVHVTGVVVV